MICYVILHYKNIDDTIKCVKSLKNTTDYSSRYIIVDNGSGDGSGEKLRQLYSNDAQCDVLLLPENLGFSKGNNEGYQYAKQKCMKSWEILKQAGYEIKRWDESNCSFDENDFVRKCFAEKKMGIHRRLL